MHSHSHWTASHHPSQLADAEDKQRLHVKASAEHTKVCHLILSLMIVVANESSGTQSKDGSNRYDEGTDRQEQV